METFPVSPIEPPPPTSPKQPWKSKTVWANVIASLLMLHPKTAELATQYPIASVLVIALINVLLRLVTQGKISLGE